jgi:serine/threonine protein kinase
MRVRVLFDHYEIREMRGVGGMSQVFVAMDSHLNRAVALKVLNRENSSKQDRIRQFEREARLTASINHQNVVRVYSVGHAQGNFYIAMELVDGYSLEELLREQSKLNEIQVLDLAIQTAEGLAAAHQVGLIHRDIKPGNILLTSEGKAKLVDFGLALVFEKDVDDSDEMWATPYYVPPEKLAGQTEDFRSDIYSLGSTFFHLLAGRPPYDTPTSSIDELREIKSHPVRIGAFAPMISGPTQQVVNRMIELRQSERYQSYDELLEALRDARQQLLASLGMVQQVSRQSRREENRRRRAWQLGALAVALTLAVVGLVLWHAIPKPTCCNALARTATIWACTPRVSTTAPL